MKIAYVLASLATQGGTERIITEKANYLANCFGYEVYIICFNQYDKETNFYPLSNNVQQINLEIPYHSQYKYKYPKRLVKKIELNKKLRESLSKVVLSINPDILTSINFSKSELICSIPCRAFKIVECHEPKQLIMSDIANSSIFSRLCVKFYSNYIIEKKADLITTLTEEEKANWKKAKRVEFFPNFSSMKISAKSCCKTKRIIAVGRLRKEKGFDKLIDIWKVVSTKHTDWQLDIYGEGILKESLLKKIKNEEVANITLRGATNNISKEYSSSSISVVTSKYEGFSLVILEAMKHGLPVVAFDCPYGPRNIIEDGKNGYLVENENISSFEEKLCSLIDNEQLRQQFSYAAIERAKHFDTDKIMLQWKRLYESLTNE